MGLDWATRVLPQVPGTSLAGCVDARPAARAEVARRGLAGAADCFASLEEALDNLEVSTVLVTRTSPSHIPLCWRRSGPTSMCWWKSRSPLRWQPPRRPSLWPNSGASPWQ